jgi:general secretion pathway protein K
MNARPARQRGIALLIALLTVALAAVLIAGLLDRGELAFARTRNALRNEQAEAYAAGLEAYAARVLLKDLADDPGSDTNTDIWASGLPAQPVPGGVITASMHDLNGCFNLNNLVDPASASSALTMFRRLLEVRGVDPGIATAVEAWLGAEGDSADVTDAYYLAQPVPYRSAQRRFAHISELRLVQGVSSDVYKRLAPFVCALPPGTRLNVNTASVPVLQTLGPSITEAQAQSLWQNGQAHWTASDLPQWRQQNIAIDIPLSLLGTSSSYFIARCDVGLGGVPFTFYSLIERSQGAIRVIERSRGSDSALDVPGAPAPSQGTAPGAGSP